HPIRTTVWEMGPVLMARILEATPAQEGALIVVFALADDWSKAGKPEGALLDLKDLRAILNYVAENSDEIGKKYGMVTGQTVATLQRKLLQLDMNGADHFFGEPAFKLEELLRTRADGKGMVHLLAAERLVQSPQLYSAFLLWLMSELWEELPEVGDPDKPKLVFFFDEAHLLFRDAPKELLTRVEQVVRLIRSKGVGVYFVTQSPADIPDTVLAQLGNRVQHALRAYTPSDQKAVRVAAQSFRANKDVDVATEIQQLNVGEALVSTLDAKGAPTPVARTKVRPPNSQVGPVLPNIRTGMMAQNKEGRAYEKAIDPESAHEVLSRRAEQAAKAAEKAAEADAREKEEAKAARSAKSAPKKAAAKRSSGSRTTALERQGGRVASGVFNTIARELMRGILGTPKRRR
ncbi:MAG TPA: DUF853 family protein, partial [Terricaulis sp.]|nr:DUF853 family protein [Terricaulis sp.]